MRITVVLLGWLLALNLFGVDITSADLHSANHHTNATPLVPGPNDPYITQLTARMLERQQYLRMPFTAEVGSKFLDRYLDALDNFHIYFIQSDLKEFDAYRENLNKLTLKEGDTTPARVIFNRFRERLQEQYDYVTNLLHTEEFTFTGNERFNLSRKTAPRPQDLNEAKRLWRERVRYEYLQEKLNIGRPEVIGNLILDKLKKKKPGEVRKAIQDKVSKEKAEEIVKIVNDHAGQKPEEVVQAVLEKLNRDNAQEIVKVISRRYTRVLRFLMDYDNDDVLQVYLTALAHVYDPHSDYMGKSELENFAIGMKLSLFGIGALLQSEDGICKIKELKPGPAQRSGKLHNNDKIIAVAQGDQEPVDVVEMPLKKVVELIRGPQGTEVRLTVIPADAPDPSVRKIVALTREEIKLEDQEAKGKLFEIPDGTNRVMRFGYIHLPSFYSNFELEDRHDETGEPKSTTTDVRRLLRKLLKEGASGIILDLRGNGGGSLDEAINLTSLFTGGGPVVQVRDYDSTIRQYNGPSTNAFYNGPLVVLTSRFSASASEILAGALQDYGRALIVGDSSTHGKGTVQSLIKLAPILRGVAGVNPTNNPGAVKITIRKFYRASGSSTQRRGVVPDIILPSVNNELEVGEAALDNALEWDTIKAAPYDRSSRLDSLLTELKRRSDARVATNRDFAFVREEMERYKKMAADKSVSMNEAQRLKEKKEADDRAKARKKELAARPPLPGEIYDIDLKDVDMPGLPPPEKKTNQVAKGKGAVPQTGTGKATVKTTSTPPSAVAESSGKSPDDVTEDSAEDKTALDINLEEAKHILADLVQLSAPGHSLAVTTSDKKKVNDPDLKLAPGVTK